MKRPTERLDAFYIPMIGRREADVGSKGRKLPKPASAAMGSMLLLQPGGLEL